MKRFLIIFVLSFLCLSSFSAFSFSEVAPKTVEVTKEEGGLLNWVASDGVVLFLGTGGVVGGGIIGLIGKGLASGGSSDVMAFDMIGQVMRIGGTAIVLLSGGGMIAYFGYKYLIKSDTKTAFSKELLEKQFVEMKLAEAELQTCPINPPLKAEYLAKKSVYQEMAFDFINASDLSNKRELLNILSSEIAQVEKESEEVARQIASFSQEERLSFLAEKAQVDHEADRELLRSVITEKLSKALALLAHNSV